MKNKYQDIEELFKESFEDYQVEPSPTVWEKISSKLNYNRRFKFKPFNIILTFTITATVASSMIFLLNKSDRITPKTNTYKTSELSSQKQKLTKNSNNPVINSTQPSASTVTDHSSQNNKTENTTKPQAQKRQLPAKSGKIEAKVNTDKTKKQNPAVNKKENPTSSSIVAANSDYKILNPEKTTKKPASKKWHSKNNALNSNPVKANSSKNNGTISNAGNKLAESSEKPGNPSSLNQFNKNDGILPKANNLDIAQTPKKEHLNNYMMTGDSSENKIQTIKNQGKTPVYTDKDSSISTNLADVDKAKINIYDTTNVNLPVNPSNTILMKNPSKWTVDVYYSPLNFMSNYASSNSQYKEISDLMKKASGSAYSQSNGININYSYKNWTIRSGIAITKFRNNFNYQTSKTILDSTQYYQVNTHNTTIYDSTRIVAKPGDTVYHLSSTILTTKDSIARYSNSQKTFKQNNKWLNNYSYVQIPIVIGYNYNTGRYVFSANGGVNVGVFINAQGKTISINDKNTLTEVNTDNPFLKINLSYYVSLGMCYKITDWIGFFVEPYYSFSTHSVLNPSYPITMKIKTFGSKFGVRFNF